MNPSCSGSGGRPSGELLGQVDRAGDLHRVRGRTVDRNVDRLVGRRVDAQARAGRPHLGLVDVGDLALERHLLVVGAGQLQAAQHAALAGLPPRPVTRPQHADGEPAVGVELGRRGSAARRPAHCSWLICWIRAGDGGAASGPYSVPGNVRMSTDSATSNRWSSVQLTIAAASGVRSGQFRQSPLLARLKAASSCRRCWAPGDVAGGEPAGAVCATEGR